MSLLNHLLSLDGFSNSAGNAFHFIPWQQIADPSPFLHDLSLLPLYLLSLVFLPLRLFFSHIAISMSMFLPLVT